jgi:type IV pilus assembly protein PilQ
MNAQKAMRIAAGRIRTGMGMAAVTIAAAVTAGSLMLTASTAPVHLLTASARGNAVVIEASEPAAYTVTRPDPLTLVVDLRDAQVSKATSTVQPQAMVSGLRFEQARAADGVAVARVRMTLDRPAEYTVKSARNTIRLELASPATPSAKAPATPVATRIPTVPGDVAPPASSAPRTGASRKPSTSGALDAISALEAKAPATSKGRPIAVPQPVAVRPVRATAVQEPSLPPAQPQEPAPAPATAPEAPAPPPSAPATLAGTENQISSGQPKQYTGHPISMDFQGVDLRSVLRTFAEISGLNMVIDPDVQGTVDIVLTDVAWDQALEVILRGNSLDYTVDGTIVRIAKLETLQKEQDARRSLAQSAANAGTLAVRTYTLSYAKAEQAAPLIRSAVLSTRGNVQTDPRTNTLIITDLPARLDTVTQLLTTLDRAEPQVEIEARIITTTREFARALGVQWGFNGRANADIGNTTGLTFPNNGSLGGRAGSQGPGATDVRSGALDAAGTAVNLGVGDATSAIGLAMGAINGAFNLDVALSALERTGKGRVLSTPRVTTQNNVEAEITQGVQIPVQTVANETVTVTFKDAALTLKVTPQITAANTVIMQITVENASPGALVATGTGNIPSIDTQRAITRVQVSDGMTTVMGGIFISREQNTNDKTPFMNRIPFLGWLFKRDSQVDESRELLIFITPRIQRG